MSITDQAYYMTRSLAAKGRHSEAEQVSRVLDWVVGETTHRFPPEKAFYLVLRGMQTAYEQFIADRERLMEDLLELPLKNARYLLSKS